MPDEDVEDEIGPWTEIKLEIIKKYAAAYSTILSRQTSPRFVHKYIDAFAAGGGHRSRRTGASVAGSAQLALDVSPPFREYHFVDIREARIRSLEQRASKREGVFVHHGDANDVLLSEVLPTVRYERYERALCLLDPYGLHWHWEVIQAAGASRAIDLIVHFPIGAINRSVRWKNHRDLIPPAGKAAMTAHWGDESWLDIAYPIQESLFGPTDERSHYEELASAFGKRLRSVAGFARVAEPILLRNSNNAPLYYLFFASQKDVAGHIMTEIFQRYRGKGWAT